MIEFQIRFLLGIEVARMACYGVLDRHLRWGICVTDFFFPLKTYILTIYMSFLLPFSVLFVSGISPLDSSFFPRCV